MLAMHLCVPSTLRCTSASRQHSSYQACSLHQQQQHNLMQLPCLHPAGASRKVKPATLARAARDDDSDQGPSQPDIDQLAAFLTQKAVEMRASLDEQDLPFSAAAGAEDDEEPGVADLPPIAAADLSSADATVPAGSAQPGLIGAMSTLEAVQEFEEEEGGFISQDFAIVKLLGKLGVQDVAGDPRSSGTATPSSSDGGNNGTAVSPNILVYAARYNCGLPYQGPVTVQLREYLAGSRRVAMNELLVQERLCGQLPADKWKAAVADPSKDCPVVQLLGHLVAPPSDEAFEMTADPSDTVWLVFKFEALRPMSLMLQQMDLPEEPSGLQNLFISKEAAVAAALAARRSLLVALAEGLLSAISYCHQRGVAHCGIGPGCVVLNTWQDKEVQRLLVKLDNFGLARIYPHPLEQAAGAAGSSQLDALSSGSRSSSSGQVLLGLEDTDAAMQRQQDLQAAALLLSEVFLVGAASAGADVMDAASLKRLLFDVFHEDVALFKEYCLQDEENYTGFVEFMDAELGAGWELLEALLSGKTSAGELLRNCRFFTSSTTGARAL